MLKMEECYICMNEGKLIKLPCACKNLPIHAECLKEWLKSCPDILQCGVCKKDISPSFIKQFVNIEDLWNYPKSMNAMHSGFRTYVGIPGIPYAELVNDKMIFESIHKKSIFLEAEKRLHMSHMRKKNNQKHSEKHSEKHNKKYNQKHNQKHMKYKNLNI